MGGRFRWTLRLHGDEPIAFPKLDAVLAMHLFGSTSRSLLVDAALLCSCLA